MTKRCLVKLCQGLRVNGQNGNINFLKSWEECMSVNMQTIEEVTKDNLCTGCGTCAGICPTSALEMVIDEQRGIYISKLNPNKCTQCGICFKVCPGDSVDFNDLSLEIFKKESNNKLIGNFNNCYLAHAIDSEIRFNSASGGLITSLLIFALEQGYIDGALVTRMNKNDPLKPEPFIAKTREEIIDASKSKYCPVPTNIVIKEILKQDGKIAVVGLPCHINGIRLAEMFNEKLKEKITLHLGIFCSHTNNFIGTDFLLSRLGIKNKDVTEIAYRCRGWPGGIGIKLINKDEIFIHNQSSLWNTIFGGFFFTPSRCLLCADVTAELADISFGDAWLQEIMANEHEGKSVIISRTEKGKTLLHTANANKNIELVSLDANDVIRSQKTFLHFKKVNLDARIHLNQLLGKKSPHNMQGVKTTFPNKMIALVPLVNRYLCSNKHIAHILKYIPLRILHIYVMVYYLLYSKIIKRDFGEN